MTKLIKILESSNNNAINLEKRTIDFSSIEISFVDLEI